MMGESLREAGVLVVVFHGLSVLIPPGKGVGIANVVGAAITLRSAYYCGGTVPPSSWSAHDVEAASRLRAGSPLRDRHQSDRWPTREQDEEIGLALQRREDPDHRDDYSQGDLRRGGGRASQHRTPSRAHGRRGRGA